MVAGADGRVDLQRVLRSLGRRRFTNVLVEGGARRARAAFSMRGDRRGSRLHRPLLAGGDRALSPIGGVGVDKIAAALRLMDMQVAYFDGDLYIHGRSSR